MVYMALNKLMLIGKRVVVFARRRGGGVMMLVIPTKWIVYILGNCKRFNGSANCVPVLCVLIV